MRLSQADRPLPSALRQGGQHDKIIFSINPFRLDLASLRYSAIGRSIRRSVQVHSIADAQWTSQNHRWHYSGICARTNLDMCSLGLPFDESLYKSEHSIEDAEIQVFAGFNRKSLISWLLQKLLKTSANPKAAKKKKKAAEKVTVQRVIIFLDYFERILLYYFARIPPEYLVRILLDYFAPGGVWRDRWGRRSPYSGGAIAGSEKETQLGEMMA